MCTECCLPMASRHANSTQLALNFILILHPQLITDITVVIVAAAVSASVKNVDSLNVMSIVDMTITVHGAVL